MSEVMKILKTRRSVRNFDKRPVAMEIIEDIIDAARLAPTAANLQPWEFIVVTQKEIQRKIAELTDYGKFMVDAPVCIVVCCRDTHFYLEDGCAATENILLAAKAQGLGSCWVAGEKKYYASKVLDILGVPAGYKLVSLIPIGYSAAEPSLPHKRSLEEVIHWEKYGQKARQK